jgi:N-carbamoylputrescine amidase
VGLVQMTCAEDVDRNLVAAERWVREAASRGAQVVCLPELFRSRYFCQQEEAQRFDLAESLPGPTTEALAPLARELNVVLVVPVFEQRAPGLYHNSAAVIDADGRLGGHYRKMHIPDDPHYHEKFYFTPGDLGFRAVDTAAGRIGILICWDQWFPEAARLTVLQGADLLVIPTAIGWLPDEKGEEGAVQREAWQTVQRGHAIANGIYLACVNRTGFEPAADGVSGIEFWGSSFICDPLGVLLAEAGTGEEGVVLSDVDPDYTEQVRRTWPFLRDRRTDAYEGLSQLFNDEAP